MIWQTVLALQEITQIMRHNPKRIFIEMTRTEEEKGEPGRKSIERKKTFKTNMKIFGKAEIGHRK